MIRLTLILAFAVLAAEQQPRGKTLEDDPGREPVGKTLGKEEAKTEQPARPEKNRKLLITTMLSSLKDEDENIRAKAAEDIAKLKPPAVEAVPSLILALNDKSPTVRYRAAETLEKIGTPKARKAVLKFRRKLGREKSW